MRKCLLGSGAVHSQPPFADLLREELGRRQTELGKIDQMLERAAAAYEAGQYDLDFFGRRKAPLLNEREEIARQIDRLATSLSEQPDPDAALRRAASRLQGLGKLLRDADPRAIKRVLQAAMDRIVVASPDDITIHYRA